MKVYRQSGPSRLTSKSGKYYLFNQNNSGGWFAFDEKNGISHLVFIEAYDAEGANWHAQEIGIYFDGISKGHDCSCCGNRWSEQWGSEYDVISESQLGAKILEYMTSQWSHHWQRVGQPEIFVHKMDGTLVGFWFNDETDNLFLAERREVKELEG